MQADEIIKNSPLEINHSGQKKTVGLGLPHGVAG
jgi:hypothetical protein